MSKPDDKSTAASAASVAAFTASTRPACPACGSTNARHNMDGTSFCRKCGHAWQRVERAGEAAK
jgi:ribosomal protein L37AE/L43A